MNLQIDLAGIRKSYAQNELNEATVASNPLKQFEVWLNEAIQASIPEPTAMVLSTATSTGIPSARVVLLKGLENNGFLFFTNYSSHKGQEMKENPLVALTFFWPELERQVRVEGAVTKVAEPVSDAYFQSRPLGSQIGAWASEQSKPTTRPELEAANALFTAKFAGQESIPRPGNWGGYCVVPHFLEFWQGRPNRLHDRIVYARPAGEADWTISRLAP